jgi:hypothetical protein
MKHIFNQVIDYKKNTWHVFTAIIIFFNMITLIAGVFEIYFPEETYFKIPNLSFFIVFCVIMSLITGIMNIIILLYSRKHYSDIGYFEFISSINNFSDAEMAKIFYHQYIYGYTSDLIISRGIYNYCFEKFDDGVPITDIAEDNRMFFLHKICQKKVLYVHITIYITTALFCIGVWHMQNIKNIIPVGVFFIFGMLFSQLILPALLRYPALRIIAKHKHNTDSH